MALAKKNVLILCHDTVGQKMAGPGIRYQNLATQIQTVASVTLAVYVSGDQQSRGSSKSRTVLSVNTSGNGFKSIFDQHDIIFAQWLSGEMLSYAKATGKIVIIDLYAPVPIEYLASLGFSGKPIKPQNDLEFSGILETYIQYLALGDLLVCSNERQRDFWIGFMTSANILSPSNFMDNAKVSKIVLCPMGISASPPSVEPSKLKLRSKLGIAKDDFVLLWTGGIWDWFDAKVVINAMSELKNPKIKLVFLGTKHPNTTAYTEEMSESTAARTLAQDLKLTEKSVFFLDGWVDYSNRASYLMDADIAIHCDKDSIETRFSHRTRVLDNIWAGLPTICSDGDYFAQVLGETGMGIVVGQRTAGAFAKVITQAFENPKQLTEIKSNIEKQRSAFYWENSTKDLMNFIVQTQPGRSQVQAGLQSTAQQPSINQQVLRRVKNSIKVLLGRIDV